LYITSQYMITQYYSMLFKLHPSISQLTVSHDAKVALKWSLNIIIWMRSLDIYGEYTIYRYWHRHMTICHDHGVSLLHGHDYILGKPIDKTCLGIDTWSQRWTRNEASCMTPTSVVVMLTADNQGRSEWLAKHDLSWKTIKS